MSVFHRLAWSSSLLLLAVCSAPLRAQETDVEYATRQSCSRAKVKPTRPARGAEAVRDSLQAAFKREVLTRAQATGVEHPEGILVFASDGTRSRINVSRHRTNLSDTLLLSLVEHARNTLARWPGRGPARLVVRLDSIPLPEKPVGSPRIECRPMYTNGAQIGRQLQAFVQQQGFVTSLDERPIQTSVYLIVTRDGEVVHAEIVRASPYGHFDMYVLSIAQQLKFIPARIDDVPIDAAVTLPVGFVPAPKPRTP
ncbi:MAG: energy transducer TonB [Gemmatimonadota bacterium]|nr:energy transducer TonB [Gemmatimonadota bacterium]